MDIFENLSQCVVYTELAFLKKKSMSCLFPQIKQIILCRCKNPHPITVLAQTQDQTVSVEELGVFTPKNKLHCECI